jgi:hypothetical protein
VSSTPQLTPYIWCINCCCSPLLLSLKKTLIRRGKDPRHVRRVKVYPPRPAPPAPAAPRWRHRSYGDIHIPPHLIFSHSHHVFSSLELTQ